MFFTQQVIDAWNAQAGVVVEGDEKFHWNLVG